MNVKRNITRLIHGSESEDNFVDLPMAQRVAFIWELTMEIWSLTGDENVEQRLQRDVTNLIKKQG